MNIKVKKLISAALAAGTLLSATSAFNVFAEDVTDADTLAAAVDILATPADGVTTEEFTGGEITPEIDLYDSGVKLAKDADYRLSYANNVHAGQASIQVDFMGNYTGSRTVYFNIKAKSLSQDDVIITGIDDEYTYTGSPVEPHPTLTLPDGTNLKEGVDYTLDYENNTDNGEAKIIVNFTGDYEGEIEIPFVIVPDVPDIDGISVSAIPQQTYTGAPIEPHPTVKYGSVTYEEGKDYTLSYENNINVGTATVIITLKGNYSGEKTVNFVIIPKPFNPNEWTESPDPIPDDTMCIAPVEAQTFTGRAITPKTTVSWNGTTLVEGTDYELSYRDNVNAGAATLTVTLKGNYNGSHDLTFTINPKLVTEDNISISAIGDQIFTGSAITPEPEVIDIER